MSHDDSVVVISSSPDFPSIDKLLAKTPKKASLRSGSDDVPIPASGLSTFTTAANVWQSLHGGGDSHNDEALDTATRDLVSRHFLTGLPRESEVKESEVEKTQQGKRNTAPATRKKRAVKSTTVDVAPAETTTGTTDSAPAPKARRKPRATKDPSEGQTTISKGKVTKAAAKEKATRKKAETVSRHFAIPDPPPKPVECVVDDEPIALEQAMRRRMDWTPPPEDSMLQLLGDSSIGKEPSSTGPDRPGISQPPQKDVFKNLMDTYSHNIGDEQVNAPVSGAFVQTSNDILGKRKLIELVATCASKAATLDTLPTKTKAPKKKPRTITDLATAAYRTIEEGDVSTESERAKQESLLDYFDAENAKDTVGKPKSKKAAKPKPTKKKAEPLKQVLLSPVSALRQVSGQDFVFGTASQLATEDDPDLLRALHEAMKASNQPDSDPFASSPVNSALVSRRKVGNRLWAAGARDDDGDLLDLELVDLTESPVGPVAAQDYSLPLPRNSVATARDTVQPLPFPAAKVLIEILSSEFDSFDLSGDEFLKPIPKPPLLSTRTVGNEREKNIAPKRLPPLLPEEPIQSNPVIDLDSEPPPSNQEHHQLMVQSQSQSHISPPKPQVNIPKRPNFETFTDVGLLKAVSAYGFKPLKKREAMIALLDQCWEMKHKKTVENVTTGAATSASTMSGAKAVGAATAPTRAKGRPKKASAVDEPTVDPVVSPSKLRGRPRKNLEVTSSQVPDKPARGRPRKDSSKSPAKAGKAKASASSRSIGASKASTDPPAASTPKRRKVASAPKAILEVADSDADDDDDPFLSSPVSLTEGHEVFSSSPHQPMDVSITEDSEDASLMATASPTTQQAFLFKHIAKAVTTAPRTTDPAEPSWHEKMLMYDPVILEDLTTWLNSGQLDRVGFHVEVAPNDVKLWCQSQSICCLWRVNLHGKTRKRL